MTATAIRIPTLETQRLRLRPMRFDDFEAYAAMRLSPRARYMCDVPDRAAAWAQFASDAAHWTLFGFGALMIERRATGETVGQVGVTQGIDYPEPELGWLLYDGHEGRGYATEAARALAAHALGAVGLATLVSYIDPANAASIAVATRLGAQPDPDAPRPDAGDLVFRHAAPAASARGAA